MDLDKRAVPGRAVGLAVSAAFGVRSWVVSPPSRSLEDPISTSVPIFLASGLSAAGSWDPSALGAGKSPTASGTNSGEEPTAPSAAILFSPPSAISVISYANVENVESGILTESVTVVDLYDGHS